MALLYIFKVLNKYCMNVWNQNINNNERKKPSNNVQQITKHYNINLRFQKPYSLIYEHKLNTVEYEVFNSHNSNVMNKIQM